MAVIFTILLYLLIWLVIDCIYRKINELPKRNYTGLAKHIMLHCTDEERRLWGQCAKNGMIPPDTLLDECEQCQKQNDSKYHPID